MNGLEIKERRRKLKITQQELANMLGVSLKTVSNYENGEVIPESKKALLHKVLHITEENRAEEPIADYVNDSDLTLLIKQNGEKIAEIIKIIELSYLNNDIKTAKHYIEVKDLLETQNHLLKKASKSKRDDHAEFYQYQKLNLK